jgi:hypothetical protein
MIRSPSGLSRFPIAPAGERTPTAKPAGGKAAPSSGGAKAPPAPKNKNRP